MIRNKTVFVLGAGASWHYGYPTGEGLIDAVISMADKFAAYCNMRRMERRGGHPLQAIPKYVAEKIDPNGGMPGAIIGWKASEIECIVLSQRLRTVKPILIDHFLAWNESLRAIGKLMIAAVILECEARWIKYLVNCNLNVEDRNRNRDAWYKFLIHKLVYDCNISSDILSNNVRFISFNYDNSLDDILFDGISSMDMFKSSDVLKFLNKDRIIHVYGSVHAGVYLDSLSVDLSVAEQLDNISEQALQSPTGIDERKVFIDQCYEASKLLRTIDPHDKEEDASLLETAKNWITEAGVVYMLGYGFDESNSRRIGLDTLYYEKSKASVMFTNFGNLNVVNKKASKLFFGNRQAFVNGDVQGPAEELLCRKEYSKRL